MMTCWMTTWWIYEVMDNSQNIRLQNIYPYVDKVLSTIWPWEDKYTHALICDLMFEHQSFGRRRLIKNIARRWYRLKITPVRGQRKSNIQWHYCSQDYYWRQHTVQLSRQQYKTIIEALASKAIQQISVKDARR
jgi:hypothetical protein